MFQNSLLGLAMANTSTQRNGASSAARFVFLYAQLAHDVALVSGVQHSDSRVHMYTSYHVIPTLRPVNAPVQLVRYVDRVLCCTLTTGVTSA